MVAGLLRWVGKRRILLPLLWQPLLWQPLLWQPLLLLLLQRKLSLGIFRTLRRMLQRLPFILLSLFGGWCVPFGCSMPTGHIELASQSADFGLLLVQKCQDGQEHQHQGSQEQCGQDKNKTARSETAKGTTES